MLERAAPDGRAHRTQGRGGSVDVQVIARVRPGDGADAEDIERAARGFREEILAGDVEAVRPGPAVPPAGAKPGDAQTWETLVITLAASGGVLTSLISAAGAWLSRQRPDTTVTLEIGDHRITLPDATPAERARLIEILAARHEAS
jgi:hypothetical protein